MEQFEFLFATNPSGDFLYGFLFLAWFVFLMTVPGILRKISAENKHLRKSLKKKMWPFTVFGALGLFFVFARFGEVETVSMPIFLFGWGFLSVLFGIWAMRKICSQYQMRKRSALRESLKKKKS